jgi:hypothetical protein
MRLLPVTHERDIEKKFWSEICQLPIPTVEREICILKDISKCFPMIS